jgi:hypothetical protein
MKQYMLSVMSVEGSPIPSAQEMEKIYKDVDALNAELQAGGAWVFAAGLEPPSTATVVRNRDGEVMITDGPFAEGKEHIGGFWVIKAKDLDAALDWARKATRACAAPIEVRPTDQPG